MSKLDELQKLYNIIQSIKKITYDINDAYNKIDIVGTGIENIGFVTCFHNAAVQLFYRAYEISHFMINTKVKKQYNTKSGILFFINTLEKLKNKYFKERFVGKDTEKKTQEDILSTCMNVPDYRIGTQDDASSLLSFILKSLDIDCENPDVYLDIDKKELCTDMKEMKLFPKNTKLQFPKDDPRTFFLIIFANTIEYNVISENEYERINNLTDIEKKNDAEYNKLTNNNEWTKHSTSHERDCIVTTHITDCNTVVDCLLNYQDYEYVVTKLDINKTKTPIIMKKKITIDFTMAKYLFITLKIMDMFGGKIDKKIKLSDHKNNAIFNSSLLYELVGVVVHSGSSIDSGHYYSYILHGDLWYLYDDFSTHNTNLSYFPDNYNFNNGQPYVLLYRQVNKSNGKNILYPTIDPNIIPDKLTDYLEPMKY